MNLPHAPLILVSSPGFSARSSARRKAALSTWHAGSGIGLADMPAHYISRVLLSTWERFYRQKYCIEFLSGHICMHKIGELYAPLLFYCYILPTYILYLPQPLHNFILWQPKWWRFQRKNRFNVAIKSYLLFTPSIATERIWYNCWNWNFRLFFQFVFFKYFHWRISTAHLSVNSKSSN